MKTAFFVVGLPASAGSKTGFIKGGKVVMVPANKRQKPWMSQIQAVAMDNCEVKLTGAINLVCEFFYDRPKSHFGTGRNSGKLKESSPKYKTTMPDLSKLVRCVEDALTGIAWKDDNQVVSITARKRWLNYKNNDSHKYQGVWIEINEII